MHGATGVSLQLHQILPLPRQTNLNLPYNWKCHLQCATRVSPQLHQILLATQSYGSRLQWKVLQPSIASAKRNLIRPWSEHNPKITSSSRSCRFRRPYSSHLGRAFCAEKKTFRAPAISQNFTKCRACHEKSQSTSWSPPSANTAPATKKEPRDWSASHMKRHLQCAEQQESPSNFNKYCPCHAKWISWLIRISK